MAITITCADDRERAAELVRTLGVGMRIEIKQAKRSTDQNSLLWAKLHDISHQVEWYGQKLTEADWKDVFSAALRKARVVPNLDADGFVQLGLHTSDMTKEEMSNLLDLIDAFAAERGVVFKDTDSNSSGDITDAPHEAETRRHKSPPVAKNPVSLAPDLDKALERFWSRVDKHGEGECWPWTRAIDEYGYGTLSLGDHKVKAHRFAYFATHQDANPALNVCHSCDNPRCCNPAHLWLGTQSENNHDKVIKGRHPDGFVGPTIKLNTDQLNEILESKESTRSLARKFGVHDTTIHRIRSGERWSHVTARLTSSSATPADDAPAGEIPPRSSPAGAHDIEEASLLSDDWREVYIVQMTGPTTRAMSVMTRDHNALQMVGTPNAAEREWMRAVATITVKRDKGKLKLNEFETELEKLRTMPLSALAKDDAA
jgi:hypothetical protein